jgi:UMF1 family MFS transporter
MAHIQTDVFRQAATPVLGSRRTDAAKTIGGQIGWVIFDSARSPYTALVPLFVFAPYFTTVVVPNAVQGQAIWSDIMAISALLLALTAPLMGAIADAGGRRKPWIIGCMILAVPCMAALWFATPAMAEGLFWVGAALVFAQLAYEFTAIFGNAMLPDVVEPGGIGALSGYGFAAANVANFVVLMFYLLAWSMNAHPWFGLDVALHEPQRAVGPLAALWMIVFSLPFLLFTRDAAGTSRSKREAVREGVRSLRHTVSTLRHHRNATMFLAARMVFNEGFIVLILFTGIFAAGVLHWTATMLVISGLVNSVFAVIAGVFAGWLDRRIGSKSATIVFVVGAMLANLFLCSLGPDSVLFIKLAPAAATHGMFGTVPDKAFFVASISMAIFVTGGFACSRALMAKLSPPHMLAEFFGLYALSGTATSFLGPLAIGALTRIFDSQRAGVGVGVFFFLVGLGMLTLVRKPAD